MQNILFSVAGNKSYTEVSKWLTNHDIPFIERRISTASPLKSKELFNLLSISQNGFEDIIKRNITHIKINEKDVSIEDLTTNELVSIIINNPAIFKTPILTTSDKILTGFKINELEDFFAKNKNDSNA